MHLFSAINAIFLPLLLTVIIEMTVWKVIELKFRKYTFPYFALSIVAVNMITNPVFNLSMFYFDSQRQFLFVEFGFEIFIIFVEASIYRYIYKESLSKFLLLAMILNFCSYVVGLILFL